jgi:hypothetical protein
MTKYSVNDRVIFTRDGTRQRGRVTKVLPHARRVVTDSGRRLEVSVRRLQRSPDRALILETRLDRSLKSPREYAHMMERWLSAYGIDAVHEKVHTVEDMRHFLRREGQNVATRFVHIIGHGTDDPGARTAKLSLTFEDLDLAEQADVFAGLEGKILIFSCCEIGADHRALETVRNVSGAAAVIAYRVTVDDWYTNLAEALLYQLFIKTGLSPHSVVEKVCGLLDEMGARVSDLITRKPVLVCA